MAIEAKVQLPKPDMLPDGDLLDTSASASVSVLLSGRIQGKRSPAVPSDLPIQVWGMNCEVNETNLGYLEILSSNPVLMNVSKAALGKWDDKVVSKSPFVASFVPTGARSGGWLC